MDLLLFIAVVLLVGMVAGVLLGFISERREWNGGTCPFCQTGTRWVWFDLDSNDSRGYKCPTCGMHIWISWFFDGK